MDFADEATMLVGLILVLGLAYMGVTFWSKKSGAPKAGGGMGGGGEGNSAGGGPNAMPGMDELDDNPANSRPVDKATALRERFKLQGRDAEVAAKVLKRMLKPGKD
jgi:hypothetical protein